MKENKSLGYYIFTISQHALYYVLWGKNGVVKTKLKNMQTLKAKLNKYRLMQLLHVNKNKLKPLK